MYISMRSKKQVAGKSRGKEEAAAGGGRGAVRKGPWTEQEDMKLVWFVRLFGERRWDFLAKVSGLNRTGKSCRLRWVNYLHPDLKRGRMSPEEERLVLDLHAKWGNRWSRIAKSMPGRTDNEIKNYWRTHMRKQDKQSAASPTTSTSSSSSSSSSSNNNNTGSHDDEDQLLYGTAAAMDQLLLWNDDMDTYHQLQGGAWSTTASTLPLMIMPSSPLSWDYCSDSLWGGITDDHQEEEYNKMLHAS